MGSKKYAAAGGVVIEQGKVLLLDRPGRGEVRLPKGHIDPGESAEQAALRETVEESGYSDLEIIADLGNKLVTFYTEGDHYERSEHYFLMRLTGWSQIERDVQDAEQFTPIWLPIDEAVGTLTYESERLAAQRAIDIHAVGG